MAHRAHLFSLRLGYALREACLGSERYSILRLQRDLLAGVTVGIIAIPLAMALAIASGVAPQYGLYSAIIGGFVIAPFFGGITATAAIARSAANFKAGAESPVAAMIHSLVVLLSLVALAPLLAYLPMPAMAALLIVVAWNMSEAPKSLHLVRHAPGRDIAVFLTCLLLTVFFDMVIAITAGVLLACILFVNEMASMTRVTDISGNKKLVDVPLPDRWAVLKINGPLFFAAADRAFSEISAGMSTRDGVILYMDGVTLLDAGGVAAMNKLVAHCAREGKQVMFADFQFQPLKTLARAKVVPVPGVTAFYPTLGEALHQFN